MEAVEVKQKQEQKRKAEEKKLKKDKTVKAKPEAAVAKAAKPADQPKPAAKKTKPVKTKEKSPAGRGKKYLAVKKTVDRQKLYGLSAAMKLVKALKTAGFVESVELHLNVVKTGLRGEAVLPHSIGKTVRVKVADDALLEQIGKGNLDFDILVSHPAFMSKLAKYAKILGPKGLMPNPKNGTISSDPAALVEKFSKGALRWKTEAKFPLIHQMIGKVTFSETQLEENCRVLVASVGRANIQKLVVKLTMSPAVKIDPNTV